MHLHRRVPMLAAVITLVGGSTPAWALMNTAPADGSSPPPALSQHHSAGSIDWVIGAGTAGAIALVGTGLAVGVRGRRPAVGRNGAVRAGSRS